MKRLKLLVLLPLLALAGCTAQTLPSKDVGLYQASDGTQYGKATMQAKLTCKAGESGWWHFRYRPAQELDDAVYLGNWLYTPAQAYHCTDGGSWTVPTTVTGLIPAMRYIYQVGGAVNGVPGEHWFNRYGAESNPVSGQDDLGIGGSYDEFDVPYVPLKEPGDINPDSGWTPPPYDPAADPEWNSTGQYDLPLITLSGVGTGYPCGGFNSYASGTQGPGSVYKKTVFWSGCWGTGKNRGTFRGPGAVDDSTSISSWGYGLGWEGGEQTDQLGPYVTNGKVYFMRQYHLQQCWPPRWATVGTLCLWKRHQTWHRFKCWVWVSNKNIGKYRCDDVITH